MSADYNSAYKSNAAMNVVRDIPSIISGDTTQLSPVSFQAVASHNAIHSLSGTAGAVLRKVWVLGISELHLLTDVGFCFYFLLNDWSPCCSLPWEMLNIPVWKIWKTSVGDLFRSVKRQRNRSLFFPQMAYFPFQEFFPLYKEPLEETLWD